MNFPTVPLLLTLSLAAGSGACDDDDAGRDLATPSQMLTYGAEASCQKAFECRPSFDATMHSDSFDDLYGPSAADCVSQRMAQLRAFNGIDYLTKLDAAAADGRVIYSAEDGATCVEAGLAMTCDAYFGQNGETFEQPPACGTTFVGAVPTAGACTLTDECASAGDQCDDVTMTCTAG